MAIYQDILELPEALFLLTDRASRPVESLGNSFRSQTQIHRRQHLRIDTSHLQNQ